MVCIFERSLTIFFGSAVLSNRTAAFYNFKKKKSIGLTLFAKNTCFFEDFFSYSTSKIECSDNLYISDLGAQLRISQNRRVQRIKSIELRS